MAVITSIEDAIAVVQDVDLEAGASQNAMEGVGGNKVWDRGPTSGRGQPR